jgi:hypothetical protein
MSYLLHEKIIFGGFNSFECINKCFLKDRLAKLIAMFEDIDNTVFWPLKGIFLEIQPFVVNVNTKEVMKIELGNKVIVSLVTSFFRLCFQKSIVRKFYVDDEIELLIKLMIKNQNEFPFIKMLEFYFKKDRTRFLNDVTNHYTKWTITINESYKRNFLKHWLRQTILKRHQDLQKITNDKYLFIQNEIDKEYDSGMDHKHDNNTDSYKTMISSINQDIEKRNYLLKDSKRIRKLTPGFIRYDAVRKIESCYIRYKIKQQLWKDIGSNRFILMERKEKNMRVVENNRFVFYGKTFIFSPLREINIGRFDVKVKPIKTDEIFEYWEKHINNTLDQPNNTLKDKVLRTIINHAKWNKAILHMDLAYSQHSSTFCLFKIERNVYTEIDGMLYRAIGRRLISKIYDKFNIVKSKYPVQPYGSLFNSISRGIHRHATDYLVSRNTINYGMFKMNQQLFWVKYGNKKIKDIPIVIKNVHWIRNGHSYYFNVSTNRFSSDEKTKIKIYLNDIEGIVGLNNLDLEYNDWILSLMNINENDVC